MRYKTVIVINAFSARLGGGQTYLKSLLAYMPKQEDISIFIFSPESLELPEDIRIVRVSTKWPVTNPIARAAWERWILPRFLKSVNASILFCPGGVVITKPPPSCKVVTVFQNMIPFDQQLVRKLAWGWQKIRNIILRPIMLYSLAHADLTIFISEHARSTIEKLKSIPNPITIPHGIDDSFVTFGKNILPPDNLPKGEYLLYVSRFDAYKHQLEVVIAFSLLLKKTRKNLSLVFVGENDSSLADKIVRLVKEFKLDERVFILGAIPHELLPGWYHHAKAILFASSCENCPYILLEAMGSGRPVLSSNVMPMPEFGGEDLAYFSPFDPHDITQTIEKVLCDEKKFAMAAITRSAMYRCHLSAEKTWNAITNLAL